MSIEILHVDWLLCLTVLYAILLFLEVSIELNFQNLYLEKSSRVSHDGDKESGDHEVKKKKKKKKKDKVC